MILDMFYPRNNLFGQNMFSMRDASLTWPILLIERCGAISIHYGPYAPFRDTQRYFYCVEC